MKIPLPVLMLLAAAPALAQSGWKAGAAKVNITPREPIWMAGYGDRNKPSESVLQDLYVKALVLEDESGTRSVLVTADLAGWRREVADAIAKKLQAKYGLSRDRLLLNASHTHSGPVTALDVPPNPFLSEEHRAVITRYTRGLVSNVVDVIGSALHKLEPARLSFGQGLAGFAVNRRRVNNRRLPGPVDHDVPTLAVRDGAGKLLAVVFGYACHNTVLNTYQINGDYAGYAQEQLEKMFPGAVALFVTGCGADANPLPRRSVELASEYGEILARAVDLSLGERRKMLTGPLQTAFEPVEVPFQKAPTREQLEVRAKSTDAAEAQHAKLLLWRLEREGKFPANYPYPVQVWQFGRDLKLIALAGEVVVDYSLRLKAQYGWDDTWVAGYNNDVFAYIPSLRVLREGGYEGGGLPSIPYGLASPFGEAVEEIIVEKVGELVKRTGGH